jgi:hypothetical protein
MEPFLLFLGSGFEILGIYHQLIEALPSYAGGDIEMSSAEA